MIKDVTDLEVYNLGLELLEPLYKPTYLLPPNHRKPIDIHPKTDNRELITVIFPHGSAFEFRLVQRFELVFSSSQRICHSEAESRRISRLLDPSPSTVWCLASLRSG